MLKFPFLHSASTRSLRYSASLFMHNVILRHPCEAWTTTFVLIYTDILNVLVGPIRQEVISLNIPYRCDNSHPLILHLCSFLKIHLTACGCRDSHSHTYYATLCSSQFLTYCLACPSWSFMDVWRPWNMKIVKGSGNASSWLKHTAASCIIRQCFAILQISVFYLTKWRSCAIMCPTLCLSGGAHAKLLGQPTVRTSHPIFLYEPRLALMG